jgi:hypothetical protein
MTKHIGIQAAGYLILLALIYEWLGIGDRSVLQVLLSAVLGAAIVLGAAWLIARALDPKCTLRRLPKFLLWMLAAAAVAGIAIWLESYRPRVALSVASRLTLWFRHPVKPQTIGAIYAGFLSVTAIAAILALLSIRGTRHWRYWAGCAVMIAAGYWLPSWLIGWVPKCSSFAAQTASWILRFTAAYAIALAAWLEIASLARRFRFGATP